MGKTNISKQAPNACAGYHNPTMSVARQNIRRPTALVLGDVGGLRLQGGRGAPARLKGVLEARDTGTASVLLKNLAKVKKQPGLGAL